MRRVRGDVAFAQVQNFTSKFELPLGGSVWTVKNLGFVPRSTINIYLFLFTKNVVVGPKLGAQLSEPQLIKFAKPEGVDPDVVQWGWSASRRDSDFDFALGMTSGSKS